MYQENQLRAIGRGPLHRGSGLEAADVIPNEEHPSGHLPIWADFEVSSPMEVSRCCAESYLKCLLHEKHTDMLRRPLTCFELQQGFVFFDMNSSGEVNQTELRQAIVELEVAHDEDEIAEVMTMLLPTGSDTTGKLTIEHFRDCFHRSHAHAMGLSNEPLRIELREAFSLFDVDGSGVIDQEELLEVLKSCSPVDVDEKAVQAIIDMADTDGSGEIDLDEFVHVCCSSMSSINK